MKIVHIFYSDYFDYKGAIGTAIDSYCIPKGTSQAEATLNSEIIK